MTTKRPPAHGGGAFGTVCPRPLASFLSWLALCVAALVPAAHATQVVPLSVEETVRQAGAVVVGMVGSSRTRWGDATQRWMLTDFDLTVEEVLYGDSRSVSAGAVVRLTYWGGTIGEERQAIADLRLPEAGERVVLMLRPRWDSDAGFTPTVGFDQGYFSIAPASAGASSIVDASGAPLVITEEGRIARRGSTLARAPGAVAAEPAAFLAWLRANIGAIQNSAAEPVPQPDPADPRILPTFAKTPSFTGTRAGDATAQHAIAGEDKAANAIIGPVSGTAKSSLRLEAAVQGRPQRGKYRWVNPAIAPIVVNSFPATFAPWQPEDQYQMSKWNYYASEVFRVYTTPSGTYGWPNGIFDLCGWPSSADLQRVYGSPWASNVIGITYYRYSGASIAEADIALNPAFSFTLDDEWVYSGSSAQGFRQVMAHELGHMWGLDHEFNDLSLMNYMPSPFRAFGLPYADDAEAVRTAYPGRAVAMTDLGVYLYRPAGFQNVSDATFPFAVTAGQSISINDYTIENVGTATIAAPTIEWYLTAARNYANPYYYLGVVTFSPALPRFTHYTTSGVNVTFTVPASVPSGFYFIGAFIRNDAGAFQSTFPSSNNLAFSRNPVFVTGIASTTHTLTVARAGNGTGSVTSTPAGIACGTTCSAPFNASSSVSLAASPSPGSTFVGWSGACTGLSSCVVTMDAAKTVTATFVVVNDQFPAGCTLPAGWITPAAASAGWAIAYDQASEGACALKSATITHGQKAQISFTAVFAAGNVSFRRRVSSEPGYDYFRFYVDGFEQGPTCAAGGSLACTGAAAMGATASGLTLYTQPGAVLQYPITAGTHTLTFSYEKDGSISTVDDAAWIDAVVLPASAASFLLTVSKSGTGAGTVSSTPSGVVCGATCSSTFASGASVTLTATSDGGSTFTGWSGAGCSGTASCIVAMDAAKTVSAVFTSVGVEFPIACVLPQGWTIPSDANGGWSAAFDQAYEGACSLKSDAISHDQKAKIRFAGRFRAGTITFRRRVASEPGYDYFRVYLDGVEQGPTCAANGTPACSGGSATGATASGDTEWTQPAALISIPVTAGNHTITFSYEKNNANSTGADAAWIDLLSLPLETAKRTDFDGNAKADLAWRHTDGRYALWLMNGIAPAATGEILGAGTGWGIAQAADLDGDGKSDLVWQHADGRAAVYLMNGLVASSSQQILNAGPWTITHATDLNGDGKADLVFRHADGSVAVWTMNGSAMVAGAGILGSGTGWSVIAAGDVNGDGKADLIWKHTDGRHAIWTMNGTQVSSTSQILNAGGWSAAHVADLDGDGKADIVWRNADGSIAAWLMNGATMASGAGILGAGTGWSVTHVGDFNGDGKADLFFQHTDGRAAIWLMSGLAPTAQAQILNAGGGWTAKRLADLNGDGKADIVWENADGRVAVWLMNGTVMIDGAGILGPGTGWAVANTPQ